MKLLDKGALDQGLNPPGNHVTRVRVRTFELQPGGFTLSRTWGNFNNANKLSVMDVVAPQPVAAPVEASIEVPLPAKTGKKKARNRRAAAEDVENFGIPDRTFLTVKQTAQRFPIFTEASIRWLIFQADECAQNPIADLNDNAFSKVIFRVPGQRRILICEQGLIEWLKTGRHVPNANRKGSKMTRKST